MASTYLNKTFSTPTNNKIWTLSFWLKRGVIGDNNILSTGSANSDETNIIIRSDGKIEFKEDVSSSAVYQFITNIMKQKRGHP